jgi:hypothetical protein
LDVPDINGKAAKTLREWETSKDIADVHNLIVKHKKLIKDKIKNYLIFQNGSCLIVGDNLVNILKEVMFKLKLSNTQWKIIVAMADKDKTNMIDIDLFFGLLENSIRQSRNFPKK